MDPYLLGLTVFLLVMAVGLSVFIGLEVYGLIRQMVIDLNRAANSGAPGMKAGGDDDEKRSYQDRRTVERLIEHFEEETE